MRYYLSLQHQTCFSSPLLRRLLISFQVQRKKIRVQLWISYSSLKYSKKQHHSGCWPYDGIESIEFTAVSLQERSAHWNCPCACLQWWFLYHWQRVRYRRECRWTYKEHLRKWITQSLSPLAHSMWVLTGCPETIWGIWEQEVRLWLLCVVCAVLRVFLCSWNYFEYLSFLWHAFCLYGLVADENDGSNFLTW